MLHNLEGHRHYKIQQYAVDNKKLNHKELQSDKQLITGKK